MKNRQRQLILAIVFTLLASLLFGYDLQLPEPAPAYKDLPISLDAEPGDPEVSGARFYLIEEGEDEPLFLELEPSGESWSALLPAEYVKGTELSYFAEVRSSDGIVHRIPDSGSLILGLEQDTTPPELRLILPDDGMMTVSLPQVFIIEAAGDEILEIRQILLNNQDVSDVQTFGSYIKGVYTPQTNDDVTLALTVADAAGNTAEQVFSFSVQGEPKPPFFDFGGDYYGSAEITYAVSGDQEGLTLPGSLFTDLEHEINLAFALGGEGMVKAGPLSVTGTLELADDRDIRGYFTPNTPFQDYPYPSALVSDAHDILRLWNPYGFNYISGYGTHARSYTSGNQFLIDIALFQDIFHYRFGDQSISFQDQTIKDFSFRGSSLQLDLPIISLSVANGFSDLGETGMAWPRAFLGFQFGLDAFDYWYLQTNISLISDYQGPYDQTSTGSRPIADLFELVDPDDATSLLVNPEENMVIGLGTGVNTKWFQLKGEAGLSFYVSDAGDVINISELLTDFGAPDISPTLDAVQSAFPVFDYFPPNDGYLSGVTGGTFWGVTYGADLAISPLNMEGWFRKTDGSYKSLGTSLSNGIMEIGGLWDISLGSWKLGMGYAWDKNNIPDIITNDIVPLVSRFMTLPDMVGDILDLLPGSVSVPEITHEAEVKLQSPNLGAFGRFTTSGNFSWEKTDTDGDVSSTDYQEAFIIGAEAGWRSKTYKFDQLSIGVNLKTAESYRIGQYTDGVVDSSTDWSFSTEGALKVSYDFISVSGSYSRKWGTSSDTDTVQKVKSSVDFKNLWFDSVGFSGSWEHTASNAGAWIETELSAGVKLSKTIEIVTTGLDFTTGFTQAADPDDEASSWQLTVFGSISL
jgi:hypothetical protein